MVHCVYYFSTYLHFLFGKLLSLCSNSCEVVIHLVIMELVLVTAQIVLQLV